MGRRPILSQPMSDAERQRRRRERLRLQPDQAAQRDMLWQARIAELERDWQARLVKLRQDHETVMRQREAFWEQRLRQAEAIRDRRTRKTKSAPSPLSGSDRERLVKFLGMTGSDHGDAAVAARTADALLRKLKLTWDDVVK